MKDYVQRIGGIVIQKDKQIKLILPQNDIYAVVNDTLLYQAVINVVANCIKYAKSYVSIELSEENEKAIIRISDDGDGICEQELPKIFDRFFKGKSGNYGLGLSIAKTSAEMMGGTISVYNKNGAVFEIIIDKCQ